MHGAMVVVTSRQRPPCRKTPHKTGGVVANAQRDPRRGKRSNPAPDDAAHSARSESRRASRTPDGERPTHAVRYLRSGRCDRRPRRSARDRETKPPNHQTAKSERSLIGPAARQPCRTGQLSPRSVLGRGRKAASRCDDLFRSSISDFIGRLGALAVLAVFPPAAFGSQAGRHGGSQRGPGAPRRGSRGASAAAGAGHAHYWPRRALTRAGALVDVVASRQPTTELRASCQPGIHWYCSRTRRPLAPKFVALTRPT